MPQINPPASNFFHQTIKNLTQRIVNLETQPMPTVSDFYNGTALTTSSATPVTWANSPVVYTLLGSSGDAFVTVSSYLEWANAGNNANVTLYIDGEATVCGLALGSSGTTGFANLSTTVQLSGLSSGAPGPGMHTFTLLYNSGNSGEPVSFNSIYLQVTAI